MSHAHAGRSTPLAPPPGKLLVHGSGGHGKVVADAALAAGWHVVGFADDDPGKAGQSVLGLPIVASGLAAAVALCRAEGTRVIIAVGDNQARRRMFEAARQAGVALATVIHPSAVLARSVTVGDGTLIAAGAVVNPQSRIGENTIINTGATIDHDNIVGDHAHVAPGAHTGGTVRLGAGVLLGIGASVRQSLSIGDWTVVGVGAAVVSDLGDHVMAYGNPARVVRSLR